MATIDNRPLKAFVRFDGTGRIVPSSLILRRKKPKVGNWVEIPAYECCNPTTTTSTTAAPTTTTTSSTTAGPTTTTTSTTVAPTTTTTTTIPPTFYNAGYTGTQSAVCAGTGAFNIPLNIVGDPCSGGTVTLASGSWVDYGVGDGATLYVNIGGPNLLSFGCFYPSTVSIAGCGWSCA